MGARCGLASNQPNYGNFCSESTTLRSQQNNDSCLQSSKNLFKTIPNEKTPCTFSSKFWKKNQKINFGQYQPKINWANWSRTKQKRPFSQASNEFGTILLCITTRRAKTIRSKNYY